MTAALLTLALAAAPHFLSAPDPSTVQPSMRVFVEAAQVVTANGVAQKCHTPDGGAPTHCTVALEPGRNVVRAGVEPEVAQLTITRYETTGRIPSGVALDAFGTTLHRRDTEQRCQPCHDLREADKLDGGATSLNGTQCTQCHSFNARRTLHGPVGQGMCLACHDAASEPRYAVKWPIQDTCFRCHVELEAAMRTKAFRHGPAAAGRCTTCHDPHGSEFPFWLKKRPFDLCTNCHTEKRTDRHVVVGFVYGDSHPIQGRPHPLKPNAEFACPACHNPHAAQARFLWQFDATRRETLCRTCHQK